MGSKRTFRGQKIKRLAAIGSVVFLSACTVSSNDHSAPTPSTRYSLTNGALTVEGTGLASLNTLTLTGQPTLNLSLTKSSSKITARPSVSTAFKLLNNSLTMAFADTTASFTISDASNLQFSTAGTERMRIVDTTGYVGIGTAIASNRLVVGDDAIGATGAPANALAIGNATGPAILSLGQSSVARLSVGWNYNATPAGASARITTNAVSNPLILQDVGGNVGIGQSSPGSKLVVNGAGGSDSMVAAQYNSNTYGARIWVSTTRAGNLGLSNSAASADAVFLSGDAANASWINAGNVGIGTTTPVDHLAVYSNTNGAHGTMVQNASNGAGAYSYVVVMNDANKSISLNSSSSTSTFSTFGASNANMTSLTSNSTLYAGTVVASPFIFGTNNISRGTILSDGKFGIGTLAPASLLQVGASGDGSVAVANAWNTFSDGRLKNIIGRIPNAGEIIGQLNGYYYTWKNGLDKGRQVGVIAQEVERVLPELVKTGSDGIKTVDYPKLTAVLIEANKEQSAKIAELQKSNQQLQQIKNWICNKDETAAVCQ